MKLITAALLVVLGAATAQGACPGDYSCPPKCTNVWTDYLLQKIRYLSYKSGPNNEGDCKKACEADPSCNNIDWDFDKRSCWFGTTKKPSPRHTDPNVNHHDLDRQCVESCELKVDWKKFSLRKVKGLAQQSPNTYKTVEKCQAGCANTTKCLNIDWDFALKYCFFGYTVYDESKMLENKDVDHYDLKRVCAVDGSAPVKTN